MDPLSRINENDGLLPEAQRDRLLSRDGNVCLPWFRGFCRLTRCLKPTVFINILWVFVPLGIAAGIFAWAPRVVFIFNILALLPLAKLLSSTLTAASERLYPLLGIVLKATIGNSVLLIVSLLAKNNKIVTNVYTGEYHSTRNQSYPGCPIQYAWKHLGKHIACKSITAFSAFGIYN
jgi:hypothetical protein